MKRFRSYLHPDVIAGEDDKELEWLLTEAIRFWDRYKQPMPEEALLTKLYDARKTRRRRNKLDENYIIELYCAEPANDATHAWLLDYADTYLKTQLSQLTAEQVADLLELGDVDGAIQLMKKNSDELGRQTEVGVNSDTYDVFGADADKVLDLLRDEFTVDARAIPTGIAAVDEVLQGGLRPQELATALAPPGTGKSQWLCFVARNGWLLSKVVAYYSLEMSETRVAARLFAGLLDIPANNVAFESEKVKRLVAEYKVKHNLTGKLFIKRYPPEGATVADIRAHVEELSANGAKPDLVIVDYGDIVKAQRSYRNESIGAQKEIYVDLRQLGVELDIAVWTASQANRDALNKRVVTLKNIADSWDKAKISDYVMAQCQTEAERESHEMRLWFPKTRNSESVMAHLTTDFAKNLFFEEDGYDADDE